MFKINDNREHRIILSNTEKTPIFIIDHFVTNISSVINDAKQARFQKLNNEVDSNYPGSRATLHKQYTQAVLNAIEPIFYKYYNVPSQLTPRVASATYSLLTKKTEELNFMQCLPHYDDVMPNSFAVLHYLNDGDFGGTGFYKHIPTNFENITQIREHKYTEEAEKYLNKHGYPKQEYFTESDNHFELMGEVEYVPNRLVIYPMTILHSAFIRKQNNEVTNDINNGRLTANFFVKFQ